MTCSGVDRCIPHMLTVKTPLVVAARAVWSNDLVRDATRSVHVAERFHGAVSDSNWSKSRTRPVWRLLNELGDDSDAARIFIPFEVSFIDGQITVWWCCEGSSIALPISATFSCVNLCANGNISVSGGSNLASPDGSFVSLRCG